MPEVRGGSGCQSCPDCWFACMGRSGQPGAGEGKPRSHQSPRGIILFYFQPCLLRYKGLQIRCISEAYLCEYLTAYPNRPKTFKHLRSIHQEPYLPMSPLGSQPLPLGASPHPGLSSAHQLPISPLRAVSWHYPQSPPSAAVSASHAGAAGLGCCMVYSQHPHGLHLCCCTAAHCLHPPPT